MRDCPIFHIEVVKEESAEFFIAAETVEDARAIAHAIAPREVDWYGGYPDFDITVRPAERVGVDHRGIEECGIWVQSLQDGRGGWVHTIDDIPQLPPKPDPNQMVLDLGSLETNSTTWGTVGAAETVEMSGGVL